MLCLIVGLHRDPSFQKGDMSHSHKSLYTKPSNGLVAHVTPISCPCTTLFSDPGTILFRINGNMIGTQMP